MAAVTGAAEQVRLTRPRVVLPTRERRPGWTALAFLLILGLGALGGWLYQQAGAKSSVVSVAVQVPAGHVISRADVSSVSVAGEVPAIAAGELDQVVGQRAAVTLLPGMLLQRSMLSSAGALAAGQAQMGVAVASGQFPAHGLQAGDLVEVLRIPPANATPSDSADVAQVLLASAPVWSIHADPAHAGGALLTLTVPDVSVPGVAAANGLGQVAVVKVAPR